MALGIMLNEFALAKQKQNPDFKQYQYALQLFWHHKPGKEVIEFLTGVLVEQLDFSFQQSLYRLWIEVLASEENKPALLELKNHLQARFFEADEPGAKASWLSMVALCTYELDQQEELAFIDQFMTDQAYIPYVAEYKYLVSLRQGKPDETLFQAVNGPVIDYFYIVTYAKAMLTSGRNQALSDMLGYSARLFDGAPLLNMYQLHLAFDQKDYNRASYFAEKLMRMYPHHPDFAYYKVQCLEQSGLHGEASQQVKNWSEHNSKRIDSSELNAYFNNMLQKDQKMADKKASPSCWMIKLSNSEYFQFLSGEVAIGGSYVRSIGIEPAKGDLCILATDGTANGNSGLRIVGSCDVSSDPQWHPMKGYETTLRLTTKIQPALYLDVEQIDSEEVSVSRQTRHHFTNYNVFQLDSSAIDTIMKACQEYEQYETVKLENLGQRLEGYLRVS